MKICIVGTGAIGGMLATRLAQTDHKVTAVDQGAHLEAMRANGLSLLTADGRQLTASNLILTDHLRNVDSADLIVLGVKAHQIATIAPDLPRLFNPQTTIVTVQNGIPWWYFQRHGGDLEGTCLESLDPDGAINKHVPAERVLGCVAYPAAALAAPGIVHHIEGNRFPVGELDGRISKRAAQTAELFNMAGFKSFAIEDIRAEIWLKAWGALSFNPISALTRATMVEICRFPETRKLVTEMMREAQTIAEKIGITFRHPIEKRIAGAESVGAHKTSMLQDFEAGRTLELEAIIGSVAEIGRLTETRCPTIDAVYACARLMERVTQHHDREFPSCSNNAENESTEATG